MPGLLGGGNNGGKGMGRASDGGDGVKPGTVGNGNSGGDVADEGGWNGLGTSGDGPDGSNGLGIRGGCWRGLGTEGVGWNGLGGNMRLLGSTSFWSEGWTFGNSLVIPAGTSGDNIPERGGKRGSGGNNGGRSGNPGMGGRRPPGVFGSWSGGGNDGSIFGGNMCFA